MTKKMIRYDNFHSLKSGSRLSKTNSEVLNERHLELERFLNLLRSEWFEKQLSGEKKSDPSTGVNGE